MDELSVFLKVAAALAAGQHVALVTVLSTAGSTPGKVGYQMLVFAEGRQIAGTVGGGLVEARMVEAARTLLAEPTSRVHRFDLGEAPDDEKGICGGSIDFLIETFDSTALPLFRDLSSAADPDRRRLLVSIILPGNPPQKALLGDGGRIEGRLGAAFSLPLAAALWQAAPAEPCAARLSCDGMDVFVQSVAPSPPVVVFGAGHLAVALSKYAQSVHFRVTVVDDRAEYANSERFPGAEAIVVEDLGRILDRIGIDGNSYVVIVTRGHKWDQIVLEQVVQTGARYIGMIGSKRKTQTILESLRLKGIPENRI
jgi:xanthine dehydrogenase accessory factor